MERYKGNLGNLIGILAMALTATAMLIKIFNKEHSDILIPVIILSAALIIILVNVIVIVRRKKTI